MEIILYNGVSKKLCGQTTINIPPSRFLTLPLECIVDVENQRIVEKSRLLLVSNVGVEYKGDWRKPELACFKSIDVKRKLHSNCGCLSFSGTGFVATHHSLTVDQLSPYLLRPSSCLSLSEEKELGEVAQEKGMSLEWLLRTRKAVKREILEKDPFTIVHRHHFGVLDSLGRLQDVVVLDVEKEETSAKGPKRKLTDQEIILLADHLGTMKDGQKYCVTEKELEEEEDRDIKRLQTEAGEHPRRLEDYLSNLERFKENQFQKSEELGISTDRVQLLRCIRYGAQDLLWKLRHSINDEYEQHILSGGEVPNKKEFFEKKQSELWKVLKPVLFERIDPISEGTLSLFSLLKGSYQRELYEILKSEGDLNNEALQFHAFTSISLRTDDSDAENRRMERNDTTRERRAEILAEREALKLYQPNSSLIQMAHTYFSELCQEAKDHYKSEELFRQCTAGEFYKPKKEENGICVRAHLAMKNSDICSRFVSDFKTLEMPNEAVGDFFLEDPRFKK